MKLLAWTLVGLLWTATGIAALILLLDIISHAPVGHLASALVAVAVVGTASAVLTHDMKGIG
jgi:hypothetical protein